MSVTFGFYNAELDNEGKYDREYSAEQLSSIFDGVITDGVYASIGDVFDVNPAQDQSSGLKVIVGTGRSWFEHTWLLNDAPIVRSLTAADVSMDRIDAVVINIDDSQRTNDILVRDGQAASTPEKPSRSNGRLDEHDYPIAYIYVRANATAITKENIENAIGVATDVEEIDGEEIEYILTPIVTSILESFSVEGLIGQYKAAVLHEISNLETLISDVTTTIPVTIADVRPIVSYNVYIPVDAWGTFEAVSGTEEESVKALGYEYRAFITNNELHDVTIGMRPYITWSLQSIDESGADILNQYQCASEVINGVSTGGVYVYATSIPSDYVLALTIECRSVVSSPIPYAYLIVDYPAETLSANCTNTSGSMRLSSTGTMFYVEDNKTSCEVTIEDASKTATQTVSIESGVGRGKIYHIAMSYPAEEQEEP